LLFSLSPSDLETCTLLCLRNPKPLHLLFSFWEILLFSPLFLYYLPFKVFISFIFLFFFPFSFSSYQRLIILFLIKFLINFFHCLGYFVVLCWEEKKRKNEVEEDGNDGVYISTVCIGYGVWLGRQKDYEGGKYAEIWRQFL